MLFTEPLFIFLLLPLACILFYGITPRLGISFGFGILLVISFLFYLPWGLFYLFLLIVSISVNFASAYFMLATPDSHARRRRIALALGLAYNFGSLMWFKYRLPVLQGLGVVNGPTGTFSAIDIAIPIGISFYTFQQAIFLVDAYHRDSSVVAYLGVLRAPWGKLRAYVHHAFFVAFFPHLIIGPIVYLKEFQPQVENQQFGRLRIRNLEIGLTLIAIGMFKKIGLADNLAPLANLVFTQIDNHSAVPALTAWFGAAAYYAQLYFDFSGYSDMALGTARVLGVRFPINFYSPLKAVSITDYYRRWHITLTRVIARFFYIPLSVVGARFATQRRWGKLPMRMAAQWLPLLLNFEAIALWHGARLTFLLFGFIHGTWYILESEIRRTKSWKAWKKMVPDPARAALGRFFFTVAMLLTFALFRSSSVYNFLYLLDQMFLGARRLSIYLPIGPQDYLLLAFSLCVLWLMPNSIEILRRYRPGIVTYQNEIYVWRWLRLAWRPNWFWASGIAAAVVGSMYFISRQPPFLYMGF